LYGYKFKSVFNIHCTDNLDIPSYSAAVLVDLLGLLCSTTRDSVSVFDTTGGFVERFTALRFTATGALIAARRIQILPMNQ
jgi:hypothetical protein